VGFELQASACQPALLSVAPCLQALSAFVTFQIGFCVYAWASFDWDPPIYIFHKAGMTGKNHYTQLFYWLRCGLKNFFAYYKTELTVKTISLFL
jgi:hypothetical protein